jgi:hypothetical protein
MRSYIKIRGPSILEAVRELEKIAIDMPQVCIMDEAILRDIPPSLARDLGETFEYTDSVNGFFSRRTGVRVSRERCNSIISESGEALGDYDFFFEWYKEPSMEELEMLIERIDEALEPLERVTYTITTRKN